MHHKFFVLPVKKLLKSVHIYGSYRKIKTGVPFFLEHPVQMSNCNRKRSVIDSGHIYRKFTYYSHEGLLLWLLLSLCSNQLMMPT